MSNDINLIFKNPNVFRLLQLFSASPNRQYYLREIARELGLTAGAIHKDLLTLEKAGLILSQVEGKNKYFRANKLSSDFTRLRPILGRSEKSVRKQEMITILFEEHWVSPLTQSANYFGWQASSDDQSFSTRLGDCAGVYYNTFLKFPFNEERWVARSREVNERLVNPQFIARHYEEFQAVVGQMESSLLKIVKHPKIDDDFVASLKDLYQLGIEACRFGYIGVVADMPTELLSRNMRAIVEKKMAKLKVKESVPAIVNLLSSPPELSKSFRREKALLKITEAIIRKKVKDPQKDVKILAASQNYFHNYYWTDFGHFGSNQSLGAVLDEFRSLSRKETLASLKRRLKEIADYPRETKAKKETLYRKLSLSKKERLVFEAAGVFALVKALRLEYLSGLNSQISRLVDYLGRQLRIDKQLLYFCRFGEILDIYENGLDPKFLLVLKSRSKFCIFKDFSDPYGGEMLIGKEAQNFYHRYVKEVQREINDIESFHGSVAYPGKARGMVKVINSPKEMDKMKEGNILVTTQTIPEMLPAMKKAAAFITNTGGITCHAAIVAREMKKPCIVGTKIATQVLSDGDFVQVDAFKGIVNIIRIS